MSSGNSHSSSAVLKVNVGKSNIDASNSRSQAKSRSDSPSPASKPTKSTSHSPIAKTKDGKEGRKSDGGHSQDAKTPKRASGGKLGLSGKGSLTSTTTTTNHYEAVEAKRSMMGISWLGDKYVLLRRKRLKERQTLYAKVLIFYTILLLVVVMLIFIGAYALVSIRRRLREPNPKILETLTTACQTAYKDQCYFGVAPAVESPTPENDLCAEPRCSRMTWEISRTNKLNVKAVKGKLVSVSSEKVLCGESKMCVDNVCVATTAPEYRLKVKRVRHSYWSDGPLITSAEHWKCVVEKSRGLTQELLNRRQCQNTCAATKDTGIHYRVRLRRCAVGGNAHVYTYGGCEGYPFRISKCGLCKNYKKNITGAETFCNDGLTHLLSACTCKNKTTVPDGMVCRIDADEGVCVLGGCWPLEKNKSREF